MSLKKPKTAPSPAGNPLEGYSSTVNKNTGRWLNKIMIGTPSRGTVRMEWVMARFGQVIPCNWSATDCIQWMNSYAPLQYLVPDAQNLIVKEMINKKFEWLLLIEDDNILPPDAFLRINEYMRKADTPVVSGLYFIKAEPSEPLLYRRRGTSFYGDWKMGDKVWVDGVPTGCLLVHASIIEELWKVSSEYMVNGQLCRRVFEVPEKVWVDPETRATMTLTGTSDLRFCERVINEKILEKAGWPEFQKKEFPFLVDTNLFVRHIADDGRIFPLQDPKTMGF